MKRIVAALIAALLLPASALAQGKRVEQVQFRGPGMMGRGMGGGIPPHLAARVGIPEDVQKKVQQLSFQANEQLINLESDLKRAQLELEKALSADKVDGTATLALVDRVTRAEGEVRKNRIGLMLKIRDALGPDLWKKLRAEMPAGRRMKIEKFRQGHGPFGQLDMPGSDDSLVEEFELQLDD
jgi:hypothetical protein